MTIFYAIMAGLGVLGVYSLINALGRIEKAIRDLDVTIIETLNYHDRY